MREWREKGRIKKEKERDREELYRTSSERTVTRVAKGKKRRRKEEREEGGERYGRWTERAGARFSRRTGRINKRNAPPSHLRHLYFAAPHGRKSSSVSERGDTVRRGEEASKKGGRE